MSEQGLQEVPEQVESTQHGIFIASDEAEGGCVMFAQHRNGKQSAVVAGDMDSATFQRKVQRIAVRWIKDFFVAPPRAPNKEKEEGGTDTPPQE